MWLIPSESGVTNVLEAYKESFPTKAEKVFLKMLIQKHHSILYHVVHTYG